MIFSFVKYYLATFRTIKGEKKEENKEISTFQILATALDCMRKRHMENVELFISMKYTL